MRATGIEERSSGGWVQIGKARASKIDIAAMERRYDIDIHRYFADALAQLQPLAAGGLNALAGVVADQRALARRNQRATLWRRRDRNLYAAAT